MTSREYRRAWRRRNADRINQVLRQRQQDDPQYAEDVREYGRKYWQRRCEGYIPSPYPIHVDGKRLYRTSEAARLLHCSAAAILKWHEKGHVPLPRIVDGRRLYTRRQVDLMGSLLGIRAHDHETRQKVSDKIHDQWWKKP